MDLSFSISIPIFLALVFTGGTGLGNPSEPGGGLSAAEKEVRLKERWRAFMEENSKTVDFVRNVTTREIYVHIV